MKFCSSEVRTKEEAPSDIDEEFAAVIVPSALNAGRRDDIFSSFARPGCSSSVIRLSPTKIGSISASKNLLAAKK